jgi:hypothetical protein
MRSFFIGNPPSWHQYPSLDTIMRTLDLSQLTFEIFVKFPESNLLCDTSGL